jgi:hypothetical protein
MQDLSRSIFYHPAADNEDGHWEYYLVFYDGSRVPIDERDWHQLTKARSDAYDALVELDAVRQQIERNYDIGN